MRYLFLMVLALAGYGYYQMNHLPPTNAEASATATSENGFVETLQISGAQRNVVLILRPEHCPSEQAQRAAALDEKLTRMHIPHTMGHTMEFDIDNPTPEDRELANHAIAVFNQGAPAVFINGMAKSNPTAEEVKAEYERTKAGKS